VCCDDIVNSWDIFVSAIKTEATKVGYCAAMNKFREFCGVSNYDDFTKMDTVQIKKHLSEYVQSIKHLRYSSCNKYLSGIELFLDMNEIIYPKRVIRKMLPADNKKPGGDLPYTTEEIQLMLETTKSLKAKFIIHLFVSTGMRPNGLHDPVQTLGDLVEMPDGCMALLIYKGSREEYWEFWTPECVSAFTAYRNSRKYRGEYLTGDSPLIEIKGRQMGYRAVRHVMEDAVERAGIKRTKTGARFDKALFTGFRKRFDTILKIDNSVNSNIAEKLMAHKKGLDGVYLKPTREECFNEFRKAIKGLTINEVDRIKAKVVEQEKEIKTNEKLQDQISSQQEQIDRLITSLQGKGVTVSSSHPDPLKNQP